MQENQNKNTSLVSVGYIVSILPILLLPIIFTPLGIVIGYINIVRNEFIHGIIQIILAAVLGAIGTHIGGAGLGITFH
jgi:hypothetical protein